jgi:hypothetical protein
MSLEGWKSFFEIGGVVLLGLTFVFGAGVVIVSNRLNVIQAKELDDFKLRFEGEQQKTALAQREAAEAKQLAGGFERDIANANERAAALEVEALKLRKELVLQGARENLLTGDRRRKLVEALKQFSGQKIDVRYSANAFMINNSVVSSSPLGDDTLGLANALVRLMEDAGWSLPPNALLYNVQGYGINVEIVRAASPSTRAAAEALAKALRDVSLVVVGPQIVSADRAQRVGTAAQALSPPLDENTIVLGVLTHPK